MCELRNGSGNSKMSRVPCLGHSELIWVLGSKLLLKGSRVVTVNLSKTSTSSLGDLADSGFYLQLYYRNQILSYCIPTWTPDCEVAGSSVL